MITGQQNIIAYFNSLTEKGAPGKWFIYSSNRKNIMAEGDGVTDLQVSLNLLGQSAYQLAVQRKEGKESGSGSYYEMPIYVTGTGIPTQTNPQQPAIAGGYNPAVGNLYTESDVNKKIDEAVKNEKRFWELETKLAKREGAKIPWEQLMPAISALLAPGAPQPTAVAGTKGFPAEQAPPAIVMTLKMTKNLKALGYTQEQIDAMTPQQAYDILNTDDVVEVDAKTVDAFGAEMDKFIAHCGNSPELALKRLQNMNKIIAANPKLVEIFDEEKINVPKVIAIFTGTN